MLEIRPSCEHCDKLLPNGHPEAMICNFECTFCVECVKNVLENVCPNCEGGFELRPMRPQRWLEKYPVRVDKVYKPVDLKAFAEMKLRNKDIDPNKR